jgi:DNA-binding beta-propeller fold protein YncE
MRRIAHESPTRRRVDAREDRPSRRDFLRRASLLAGAAVLTARCSGVAGGGAETWGGPGRRDGQFQRPRAINVYEGEVYVIDTSGRVQVFSTEGEFRRLWSTPDYRNGTPTGLTFTTDRVIIPDTHYSHILEYTREGRLLESWGEYGTEPGQFIYPTDVALGADGSYYICEYGGVGGERVCVFDSSKRFVRLWGELGQGPGQFNRLMGIELGRDGDLYLADTANHRIQCFDTEGNLQGIIGRPGTEPGCIRFPYQIALAPDGTLLVCEYGNHRISRFTKDGTFRGSFGGPGRGSGQFAGPRGVAVSADGWVYVADTDNHRVQRFRLEALA